MKTKLIVFLVAVTISPALTAAQQQWKGRVSDAQCGTRIDPDCTKKCLASGIAPVLVIDDTNDVLQVSPVDLFQKYAGEHVEVVGARSGDVLKATSVHALSDPQTQLRSNVDHYRGNYRITDDHVIGIDTFVNDSGSKVLLFADLKSGAVRELFETSDQHYEIGPGFAVRYPVQTTLRFRVVKGEVSAIELRSLSGHEQVAARIETSEQEVSFSSGDATLHGTLIYPVGSHPVSAIVLLHGSGPLTRSSFGPYPRFFASLGLAVLIYDKRSAGASTGEYLPENMFYPQPFIDDALAAVAFLKSEPRIRPNRIGLWGSSEGGMLTTQVAARSRDVAFIINSSGFMMPLWKEMLYNRAAELRAEGFAQTDADDAASYQQQLFDVGRTGEGWAVLKQNTLELKDRKWFARFFEIETPSLETLRWRWRHVYSFDPISNLGKVHCPVLGLFGELDTSTPSNITVANLEHTLRQAGNVNVTVRIFQHANHSLTIATTGADKENIKAPGLAPGVFVTIRKWLHAAA